MLLVHKNALPVYSYIAISKHMFHWLTHRDRVHSKVNSLSTDPWDFMKNEFCLPSLHIMKITLHTLIDLNTL